MPSQYSDVDKTRIAQVLESIKKTILQLIEWNEHITSSDDYYASQHGSQLLAADCTLITAIGEGINRINRTAPGYLHSRFPDIPWYAIVGMRNHIAHGYFEIDADIVYETVKSDIPGLLDIIDQLLSTE
ncbi:MAG: DUF86 domain-containing protein [Duncaniella sp.]|nr:DUF86 domain-containing protein [Duncaniella sp.]